MSGCCAASVVEVSVGGLTSLSVVGLGADVVAAVAFVGVEEGSRLISLASWIPVGEEICCGEGESIPLLPGGAPGGGGGKPSSARRHPGVSFFIATLQKYRVEGKHTSVFLPHVPFLGCLPRRWGRSCGCDGRVLWGVLRFCRSLLLLPLLRSTGAGLGASLGALLSIEEAAKTALDLSYRVGRCSSKKSVMRFPLRILGGKMPDAETFKLLDDLRTPGILAQC